MQVMGKQGKNLNPATLTPRWFTRNPETARGAVRQVRAGRVKGVCFPPQAPLDFASASLSLDRPWGLEDLEVTWQQWLPSF